MSLSDRIISVFGSPFGTCLKLLKEMARNSSFVKTRIWNVHWYGAIIAKIAVSLQDSIFHICYRSLFSTRNLLLFSQIVVRLGGRSPGIWVRRLLLKSNDSSFVWFLKHTLWCRHPAGQAFSRCKDYIQARKLIPWYLLKIVFWKINYSGIAGYPVRYFLKFLCFTVKH